MIAFSLNLSARDCSQEFDFKLFINVVFTKFADAFVKNDAFPQWKFWSVFEIFHHRKLPDGVTKIWTYRNQKLTVLTDHYGKEKVSTCKSVNIKQVGDIDGVAAIDEWPGFCKYMSEKNV